MKILLLTPSLPYPPHQGGAIRNFGLLQGLADAGHEITLMSFHDNSLAVETTPLARLCKHIITVLTPQRTTVRRLAELALTTQPDLAQRLYCETFLHQLRALLAEREFDLVQFEGLEMAVYLSAVRQAQPEVRTCYDAHNAEFLLQQDIFLTERRNVSRWPAALYSWIQSRRIAAFERNVCQQADTVIAVSEEDASALSRLASGRRTVVVPNGVYTSDYEPLAQKLNLGEHVLVFTGKMDYRPNVDAVLWFVGSLLPEVRQNIPDVRVYIVGQKPDDRLQALSAQEGVFVTGWVPDIRPYLFAADVYIAPLRMGSGTRLKILEALAAGCAVVSTPAAASGLTREVEETMVLADEKEFASAVVDLLRDPTKRDELRAAAQRYVRRYYDWQVLIPTLLSAYKEIGLG